MKNGIFKLYSNDFVKSLVMAIIAAILVVVSTIVLAPNFDAFSVNWAIAGKDVINGSIIAAVSYLIKNLFTTDKGSILNITPNKK